MNETWKCVMCEMNNPGYSGSCFICGTEKSYSQRLTDEMKKREVKAADAVAHESGADAPKPVMGSIFGDAVYTKSHDPHFEDDSYPEEIPPAEESVPPEIYDHDDDESFLAELNREKKKKEENKITVIVCVVLLILAIVRFIIMLIDVSQESDTDIETAGPAAYIHDQTAYTVSCEIADETENTISKDVLKCFA